ncbi:MAG TPA: AmmeMemoRadiSam system radical SAM enzyme [Chthoniobacterales bacterium]|nr:AmmeMemoRadiSam system radical SAM enzyme [Chthoniobacterales bacterium]
MSVSERQVLRPGVVRGQWWHHLSDGRVQCDLCPRECKLHDGQRGFCFVRQAQDGGVNLTSYGRASGFCIDPIEKKPLNHFYPGTSVLSFGTAGCNLGCRFCQNWDISKARVIDRVGEWASPDEVAEAALGSGCGGIAFTYNDPVIFAEYAIDCAQAAHERNIKTVAVTAGYINPEPRREFYAYMDAANVDLKAFTGKFYHRLCFADLEPVLDTLRWLRAETGVWIEVTTLLIPGHNDSEKEIASLSDWFVNYLGPDVPLHFTAFHPDFKMLDIPPTPPETLIRARKRALAAGLLHVYVGNVYDTQHASTYCGSCHRLLIERNWYELGAWNLDRQGHCKFCGATLAGHFDATPGAWGRRRLPVSIRRSQ